MPHLGARGEGLGGLTHGAGRRGGMVSLPAW